MPYPVILLVAMALAGLYWLRLRQVHRLRRAERLRARERLHTNWQRWLDTKNG